MFWRKFSGERVNAEGAKAAAGFARFEEMNAAEVTAVSEAKDAAIEFERYVNVNVLRLAVCPRKQLSGGAEPQEPAIQAKVDDEDAAIQFEQQVFAKPSDAANDSFLRRPNNVRGRLRLRGDGVEDVNASNCAAAHERANSLCYGFDFRKFGHGA
jgi:hypothetical protein